MNGINENGFHRNKGLACEEKGKQCIRESSRDIYHASGEFRNRYNFMKECVESNLSTYHYATLHLKNKNVDIAIFFLECVGSFSLISKLLRKYKKVGMIAVKNNPNIFQYIGKNLKVDDEIFYSN